MTGQNKPKMCQDGPTIAPSWEGGVVAKTGAYCDHPSSSKNGSRTPLDGSKMVPRWANTAPRQPKIAP